MSVFRKSPLFAGTLAVCALLVLGEGWCIYERAATSRATARQLVEKRAQLAEMTTKVPAPTREVAKAIESDLTRAREALTAMQAELKGRGAAAERMQKAKVPAARTDAYFDLATFIEKTRELAKKNDIDVRPEAARFGFAAHAHEAPDVDRIEAVFHQRQVAQYLLEALIDAHPRALLAVQREAPLTKKEREDRAAVLVAAAAAAANGTPAEPPPPAEPTAEGPDFFVLDPRVSVRAPGFLDSTAFRLVFVGETGSLRAFLNKLAGFELPVLVREVEVEPATPEESLVAAAAEEPAPEATTRPAASVLLTINGPARGPDKTASRSTTSATAPIVAKPFSKFTVTVEHIELVPPAVDPAAPPPS
jgi:hypothetical protein